MHSLIQKGYTIETAQNVLNELDFAQDEEVLDDLLQKDLEKFIINNVVNMTVIH